MKKETIHVAYDEEKTAAARLYMKQKNLTLEEELAKAMELLYIRNVPSGVREFIDMRSGVTLAVTERKNNNRKEGATC